MSELLRVYLDPAEIASDGYPFAWRRPGWQQLLDKAREIVDDGIVDRAVEFLQEQPSLAIKDLIREQAGYRCERCKHPYPPGITKTHPRGEWTPCDEQCTHGGPWRQRNADDFIAYEVGTTQNVTVFVNAGEYAKAAVDATIEAQWRILTTHHLNGIKHDCRWWNLAALCQRCHLTIQGKVYMERPWNKPHTEWFKPHAAGYYASLGELLFPGQPPGEPSREYVLAHLESILDKHATQEALL